MSREDAGVGLPAGQICMMIIPDGVGVGLGVAVGRGVGIGVGILIL